MDAIHGGSGRSSLRNPATTSRRTRRKPPKAAEHKHSGAAERPVPLVVTPETALDASETPTPPSVVPGTPRGKIEPLVARADNANEPMDLTLERNMTPLLKTEASVSPSTEFELPGDEKVQFTSTVLPVESKTARVEADSTPSAPVTTFDSSCTAPKPSSEQLTSFDQHDAESSGGALDRNPESFSEHHDRVSLLASSDHCQVSSTTSNTRSPKSPQATRSQSSPSTPTKQNTLSNNAARLLHPIQLRTPDDDPPKTSHTVSSTTNMHIPGRFFRYFSRDKSPAQTSFVSPTKASLKSARQSLSKVPGSPVLHEIRHTPKMKSPRRRKGSHQNRRRRRSRLSSVDENYDSENSSPNTQRALEKKKRVAVLPPKSHARSPLLEVDHHGGRLPPRPMSPQASWLRNRAPSLDL